MIQKSIEISFFFLQEVVEMEKLLIKFEKINLDQCYKSELNLSHKEKKTKLKFKLKNNVDHIKRRLRKLEITLFFLREKAIIAKKK